jgi:hypothetical protein
LLEVRGDNLGHRSLDLLELRGFLQPRRFFVESCTFAFSAFDYQVSRYTDRRHFPRSNLRWTCKLVRPSSASPSRELSHPRNV